MQLKLMCHGEQIKCEHATETIMCSRELMLKVIKSLVRPQLMTVIHRVFEVQELYRLADIVSLGENQLHHVVQMCEHVARLKDNFLKYLNIEREHLLTAVLFHDCGKGREIDDRVYDSEKREQVKVPKKLKNYGVPHWVEFCSPIHNHIEHSISIAETYNLNPDVLEAVAFHHHVKIMPEVLNHIAGGLYLPNVICEDILHHKPEQYAATGSNLAQVVSVIDQLCAIERKFEGKVYLTREPEKMEDELVKDLVIGVTDSFDPRIELLGNHLLGNETVLMFDLRAFGLYVQANSEYKVQAVKREVLNTIRSVVRVQDQGRAKDMVGLIGGDEFAVITKVNDSEMIQKMIGRIKSIIKTRTGLSVRYGYQVGGSIEDNFHEARKQANLQKYQ